MVPTATKSESEIADANILEKLPDEILFHILYEVITEAKISDIPRKKFVLERQVCKRFNKVLNNPKYSHLIEKLKKLIVQVIESKKPGIVAQKDFDHNYESNGWTSLTIVASYDLIELAELIIKKGTNINGEYGVNPLLKAIEYNKTLNMAKLLVENVSNVNAKENYGWTPLIKAADMNNLERAKFLLDNNADINTTNDRGSTALIVAAIENSIAVAKLLVERGAQITIKDTAQKTALMWAKEKNHTEIVELLENAEKSKNEKK